MTKENVIKLYKHFCRIAEGDFRESDFDYELGKGEDKGRMQMGKMSPERKKLIVEDAKKNKEALENKRFKNPKSSNYGTLCYPYLTEKQEETKPKKKA